MVVILKLFSKMLHVPRDSHPDYLECPHLRTVSKDKFLSLFCETPSSCGEHQNTLCPGPRFPNMVMTFVLYPLSHYNSITEPCARLLLSLTEDLTIDFPYHFILSLIDVYKNMETRDKLIFPFAIIRIIHDFSVSYPESTHFTFMGALSAASIRWSEAWLQPKQPRTETAIP